MSRLFACVATLIEIELDQRRSGFDLSPDLHPRSKARAFQRHGIDADVHQHFHATGRAQRDRMAGAMQMRHLARAGRAQDRIGGINRNAVADQLLRKDRIGNAFQRIDYAGKWRAKNKKLVAHLNGNSK